MFVQELVRPRHFSAFHPVPHAFQWNGERQRAKSGYPLSCSMAATLSRQERGPAVLGILNGEFGAVVVFKELHRRASYS